MSTQINYIPMGDQTLVGKANGVALNVHKVCQILGAADGRPRFSVALANTANVTTRILFLNLGKAIVGGNAVLDDPIRVLSRGLVQGLAGAPLVGDPVYVNDTGDLDLVAGTNTRQVGVVVQVDGGPVTYDIWFDGAATTYY